MVETSDEWIVERTGIRERRIASDDESAASMAIEAGRMALKTGGVDGSTIDLVVCATATSDYVFPTVASRIQAAVGATDATAFDVASACVGFITALATATHFIDSGAHRRALVVSSEVISRITDWSDRGTCVLHGDGAGAVVLEKADDGGPTAFVLRSDGTKGDLLRARSPVGRPPSDCDTSHNIVMNGPEVFRLAVRSMESAAREALASAGLAVEDVGCFIPHQANARIIAAVAKNLHLPPERVVETIDRYGNSGSSSIALALCEAWEDGRLHPGDNLLLAAFGGGLVWGGCVIRWTGIGPEEGMSAG